MLRELKVAPQPRARRASSQFQYPEVPGGPSISEDKIPPRHPDARLGQTGSTGAHLDLGEIATSGTSFKGKSALLTGVERGSIGIEISKDLSSGGARVAQLYSLVQGLVVPNNKRLRKKFDFSTCLSRHASVMSGHVLLP